ncbi:cell division protein SepF [Nocardioides nematodiphilus]|uniref:cell division protein SepF n=1 Tax=Nocardioides nematodiphilus TaxID=2849669 RepID=UPI001CD9A399|nr:cell division protein SepF [Nocardioides nematodiphilus]MCA1982497.1 cell division protein SepF [Nocardioides nematodiphilus]
MSGMWRKAGEYLGLLEDTGRYDEESAYDRGYREDRGAGQGAGRGYERDEYEAAQAPRVREQRPAPVADLSERRRPVAVAEAPAHIEFSRIVTVSPANYNEARTVGETYRDGIPVIMNLTDVDDTVAKRLIDFAAGLIFATRGDIERVTNKVFLLSPPNVSIAAEDKARLAEGGFFNQS